MTIVHIRPTAGFLAMSYLLSEYLPTQLFPVHFNTSPLERLQRHSSITVNIENGIDFQHPQFRTLPVISAGNIRNICSHFTRLNIRIFTVWA